MRPALCRNGPASREVSLFPGRFFDLWHDRFPSMGHTSLTGTRSKDVDESFVCSDLRQALIAAAIVTVMFPGQESARTRMSKFFPNGWWTNWQCQLAFLPGSQIETHTNFSGKKVLFPGRFPPIVNHWIEGVFSHWQVAKNNRTTNPGLRPAVLLRFQHARLFSVDGPRIVLPVPRCLKFRPVFRGNRIVKLLATVFFLPVRTS